MKNNNKYYFTHTFFEMYFCLIRISKQNYAKYLNCFFYLCKTCFIILFPTYILQKASYNNTISLISIFKFKFQSRFIKKSLYKYIRTNRRHTQRVKSLYEVWTLQGISKCVLPLTGVFVLMRSSSVILIFKRVLIFTCNGLSLNYNLRCIYR